MYFMVVETTDNTLLPHQLIINNVKGTNLVKADCPTHGINVYFERVEGDLFECANRDHHEVVVYSSSNLPQNLHDR